MEMLKVWFAAGQRVDLGADATSGTAPQSRSESILKDERGGHHAAKCQETFWKSQSKKMNAQKIDIVQSQSSDHQHDGVGGQLRTAVNRIVMPLPQKEARFESQTTPTSSSLKFMRP